MRNADLVDDDFQVGFNQKFEIRWYRAEQAGRVVMVLFTLAAGLGLLGRGPFSHASAYSASGALSIDYEPISRHGTPTMVTVHIRKPQDVSHRIELRVNQQIIEPMGFQNTIPRPDSSSVSDEGMRLSYTEEANQTDALIRFQFSPNIVGRVPMHLSDGADTINWTMLVAP